MEEERNSCLEAILNSNSTRKLIVAGAGTGKTFTFKQILEKTLTKENLAITFINMLVDDMRVSFGNIAEVKTFHKFCKKILHEQNGKVDIISYLTEVIISDAIYLGFDYVDFDTNFQNLVEDKPEIKFYLDRGNYYEKVCFNDAVYRLYKELQKNINILPNFEQIVVDEYQDFNLLEVEFIKLLQQKGSILIVGDDDQAVYSGRGSTPEYLRKLHSSDEFEKFQLPYCSRCTDCVVKATNSIIHVAQEMGYLKDRIDKRYECYLPQKNEDSIKYPKIVTAQFKTARSSLSKYIDNEIKKISAEEIIESNKKKYPTVLIIGKRHYLKEIFEELSKQYTNVKYKYKENVPYSYANGYELLMSDSTSNLGWRLLIEFFMENDVVKAIIKETQVNKQMVDLLPSEFIEKHLRVVQLLNNVRNDIDLSENEVEEIALILGENFDVNELIAFFIQKEETESEENPEQPTILLSTFVGSKGLSAGFVFIVGANNGLIPELSWQIQENEIAKFVVALTRTIKKCYILSDKWLISPFNKKGYIQPSSPTIFLDFIPDELIEDLGLLGAKDLK